MLIKNLCQLRVQRNKKPYVHPEILAEYPTEKDATPHEPLDFIVLVQIDIS